MFLTLVLSHSLLFPFSLSHFLSPLFLFLNAPPLPLPPFPLGDGGCGRGAKPSVDEDTRGGTARQVRAEDHGGRLQTQVWNANSPYPCLSLTNHRGRLQTQVID